MRPWISGLLIALAAAGLAQAEIGRFAALEGVFERELANGQRVRERWWSEGPLLRGEGSRLGPDGQWVVEERMLLVEIGPAVYYLAHPSQNPYPVAFELISFEDGEAVFENRSHDFPQRIAYRVDDAGLHAWIAGADEERIEFEFRKID